MRTTITAADAFGLMDNGEMREDPTGAQVIFHDRPWDVAGTANNRTALRLVSFNRERFVTAPLDAVTVLVRDYPAEDAS